MCFPIEAACLRWATRLPHVRIYFFLFSLLFVPHVWHVFTRTLLIHPHNYYADRCKLHNVNTSSNGVFGPLGSGPVLPSAGMAVHTSYNGKSLAFACEVRKLFFVVVVEYTHLMPMHY